MCVVIPPFIHIEWNHRKMMPPTHNANSCNSNRINRDTLPQSLSWQRSPYKANQGSFHAQIQPKPLLKCIWKIGFMQVQSLEFPGSHEWQQRHPFLPSCWSKLDTPVLIEQMRTECEWYQWDERSHDLILLSGFKTVECDLSDSVPASLGSSLSGVLDCPKWRKSQLWPVSW